MSSDFGRIAMNDRKEYGAYNVSKAGLNMLVTQFTNEYAEEGITFIPMHPGYVTPLHLLNAVNLGRREADGRL